MLGREKWREVKNLSGLEKYRTQVDKEYADFIHHTPFYSFPFISKISGLWKAIYQSDDSYAVKFASCFSALGQTISYLLTAAIAAPIKAFYTSDGFIESEHVKVIVYDPENKLPNEITGASKQKIPVKTILETDDHYKLVAAPRYKDFSLLQAIAQGVQVD